MHNTHTVMLHVEIIHPNSCTRNPNFIVILTDFRVCLIVKEVTVVLQQCFQHMVQEQASV